MTLAVDLGRKATKKRKKEWDFGALGARGSNFFFFFKHDHVAHQIEGDDEQNRMQVKVSS